jgi:hypothetical protein
VDFAFVYVAEAHANDEWQLPSNLEDGAVVNQQTTLEQRRQQAQETMVRLDLGLPLLLDEMDNRASAAFAAWPERLVLVGAEGRIVYPGSPGPWGFSPEEVREQLVAHLKRR